MFRKLSILALAALFSVAMSAEATERELPVSKYGGFSKNARKTKGFQVCTNDGSEFIADDDYGGNLHSITYLYDCDINNPGEDDVIGYVARMCMPDNYYYNGSLYLGGFDGYTPPPVITCVSNLMFTATGTTNNKGKGCGHMGKKGVIYNTINYQSVLYGPNDLSGYEDCVSDAGSGGFDYYQCWDKYYDTVITGITPRGPDFEKSKITDIEFEDDNEIYTIWYKTKGWNPFW